MTFIQAPKAVVVTDATGNALNLGGGSGPFTAAPQAIVITDGTGNQYTVGSGIGAASFPLLAPNGSSSAPSYSFSGQTNAGMYYDGNNVSFSDRTGLQCVGINSAVFIEGAIALGWAPGLPVSGVMDIGISRVSAGTLGVGTGAAGATNANLQLNQITKYLGLSTAAAGVPFIVAATVQKSETAADASVLTFTPPASAGSYRVRFVLSLSAANAATLGWTATWKDSNANAQAPTNLALTQSGTAAPALTFTTSAPGNYYGYADIDTDASATNIVVKLTFAGTSFTGKVTATIEKLV